MQTIKLGEIASFQTGPFGTQFKASEYTNHGIPVINVKNIGYGNIIKKDLEYINEATRDRLASHVLQEGDIVFGRKGSVDRHAYITSEYAGWVQGSDCIRVRCNKNVNSQYISHQLKLNHVKKQINDSSVGSTMASLNNDILRALKVMLPEIGVQNRIETVLSLIEKKVRINDNTVTMMESMAKTIYEYWFVQFDFPDANGKPYRTNGGIMTYNKQMKRDIPQGWKVGNLYDIAEFINGLACQKYRPKSNEDRMPVIKIKEMNNGISSDTEFVSLNIPVKYKISDGDILFSWSASLLVMYWAGGNCGLNQHIFKVVPKNKYPREYVFHQLSAYIVIFIKMAEARKTTMGHITTDHLIQSRIVLPPDNLLCDFNSLVQPMHKMIIDYKAQNLQLTKLRDWLLPMLMNGQAIVD